MDGVRVRLRLCHRQEMPFHQLVIHKANAIYPNPNAQHRSYLHYSFLVGRRPFFSGSYKGINRLLEKVARINIEIRVLLRDMSLEIVKPANRCWTVIYGTFDTVLVGRIVGLLVTSEVLGVYEFFAAITTAMPLIGVMIPSMTPQIISVLERPQTFRARMPRLTGMGRIKAAIRVLIVV